MKTAKVSVIIPVKNRLGFLRETLKSILAQSLKPHEIIVVNDHSTEDTRVIEKEFREHIIFTNSPRKGPGAARNIGLEIATGDYIQFFDSDDIMSKNKLEDQAIRLRIYDADVVLGPYIKAVWDGQSWCPVDDILQYYPLPNKYAVDEWVLQGWCSITQACMFESQLIKHVGKWREDIFTHEDYEYWYRIGKQARRVVHTNKSFVIYRQHPEQLTNKQTNRLKYTSNFLKAQEIIRQNKNGKHYDLLTTILFNGKEINNKIFLEKQKARHNLKKTTQKEKILWHLYRLIDKYYRKRSKTNWPYMYGALKSEDKMYEYEHLIPKTDKTMDKEKSNAKKPI